MGCMTWEQAIPATCDAAYAPSLALPARLPMRRSLLAACIIATLFSTSLTGCSTAPTGDGTPPSRSASVEAATTTADARFAAMSQQWLDGWLRLQPVLATQTGDHRHDTRVDDFSPAGRDAFVVFTRAMQAQLAGIDARALSNEYRIDASILRNQLAYDLWQMETYRAWAWDPQVYSQVAGSALYTLMARDFAPLPERMQSATARMEALPTLFAQMRANLDVPRVPAIHAQTVAKQHAGVMGLVESMLLPHAAQLQGADRTRFDTAVTALRTAATEHQRWLDTVLVPGAKGEFRIGAELYDQKLAFALNSPLSRADIRMRAEAQIRDTRREMYDIARGVLKGRRNAPKALPDAPSEAQQQAVIEAALELAYAEKPPREGVVDLARSSTDEATAFVRAKNLVTVPDAPVQIILMPEFQRGVAVAYCDSPGPLDKQLDTFYAVSPIDPTWTKTQVDSYLREYNTRSIHELSIHEAMPGHYLQIWHSNQHPSTLRAVLSSGSFVEGWGMYAEKVMADAGYMDGDPLMQLIQRKWSLRATANAILDQAIHVDGMTRDDAMRLMTVTTFQQEREAAGKWVRAQLTSAQLPTYFVGYSEHLDLRREVEAREGAAFDIKRYHDKVLSFGSPPVRYARQQVLGLEVEG